jgi:YD repeat-containing protein
MVTTYEYGGTNESNNLNVTGVIVSSNGENLRTCYEYDDYGRQIGETSPRAGLGACP